MGDKFSKATVTQLAKRAGYICSNPKCNRMTIGPSENENNSIVAGVASHIRAGSVGGPRYDANQTSQQRKSISNGLWLCGTCSYMIDKNDGSDYSVSQLEDWKKLHEGMVKDALEGSKRIIFRMLQSTPEDYRAAEEIVTILSDKGMLLLPYDMENPEHVLRSVEALRRDLVTLSRCLDASSKVKIISESMAKACRYYMNQTSVNNEFMKINTALGAFRKVIGLNLAELLDVYKVDLVNKDLLSIIPRF
ncbi:hypothetical protein ACN9PN_28655 [Klebsiella pasteurii]|uniref:hypothetical protein n=1 Tax=Klebsiella TaxID=570 RepID=UPI002102898E|nr:MULTISPECIES: hypothetical protein [Klebsiella]MDH0312950.1 hypothetical protein [Klebsiella pasteurii]UTX60550.1 hypothetical protein MJ905_25490 [Klebsiella michiganensis]